MGQPVTQRLREKLDALRLRDRHGYDTGDHGYAEDPPLTEAELAQLEAEYEISFPDELRAFWLHVHGGGAGPHYGLLDPRDGEGLPVVSNPSAEFPLTAEDARAGEPIDAGRATDEDGDLLGVWPLVDVGCGLTEVLVVTGPQRGFVWSIGDGLWAPHRTPDGKQRTFFDWYEHWLDEGLAKCPPIGPSAGARSVYVLELHNELVQSLFASAEPAELRTAVEAFCADSRKYAFLPPKPEAPLGVWVVEANAVKRFVDVRPHLALVKGDREARFDRPEEIAALLEGVRGMPPIGAFHAVALWDAIEQQLPKLEGTPLRPGETIDLASPLSRRSALTRTIGHGAWPWATPPAAEEPQPPTRPSLAGRVARFLGLH